jgi:two-component system LytT family response regulator
MNKIKALIIDDEERAVRILKTMLEEYTANVEIIATANSVPEGVLKINELQPELVFLDIEMPEYNGFELLKFFKTIDFEIIFVTAYSEYAMRAFQVSAVDYLLKPVEVDLLKNALQKFAEKKEVKQPDQRYEVLKTNLDNLAVKRIALPVSDGLKFVEIDDIIALQADGSYTHVFLKNGSKQLVSKKIKFFEEILLERVVFFRTHRSFIINLNYMTSYLRGEGTIMMDGNLITSISRDKKIEFENKLKQLKLMI